MKYLSVIQKIFLINSISVATVFLLLTACNKDTVEQLSTELKIMVTNDSLPQSGASVKLYRTLTDLETRIRPVDSAITNSSGLAVFKNLQPVQYFVHASYDNGTLYYDNSSGNYDLSDDLVDGAITVATIPIKDSRPSAPTKLVVKSVTVIRFDTTEWDASQSKSCSKDLVIQLNGLKNTSSQVLGTTNQTATFCFYQGLAINIPEVAFPSPIKIPLDQFVGLSLDFFYIDETNTVVHITFDDVATDISVVIISNFINGNKLIGEAYPTRIRALEGEIKSPPGPRYAKYIVDLRVSWE